MLLKRWVYEVSNYKPLHKKCSLYCMVLHFYGRCLGCRVYVFRVPEALAKLVTLKPCKLGFWLGAFFAKHATTSGVALGCFWRKSHPLRSDHSEAHLSAQN